MDINEALNIAKQLKNHFRVFERLDELIKEGVAAQQFIKEFDLQKPNIEQEIVVLTEEKNRISNSAASLKKKKFEEMEKLTKQLLDEYSNRSDEINKEIETLETKREEVRLETEKAEKEHVEKMEAMEKERKKVQRRLDEIKGEIVQIKRKLE